MEFKYLFFSVYDGNKVKFCIFSDKTRADNYCKNFSSLHRNSFVYLSSIFEDFQIGSLFAVYFNGEVL